MYAYMYLKFGQRINETYVQAGVFPHFTLIARSLTGAAVVTFKDVLEIS